MNFIDGSEIGRDDVILGVRPEKMFCGNEIKLSVNVDSVELLGSEKIIYFTIGERRCCAKIDASREIGKTVELGIAKDDLHYFNKETLNRL